MRPILASTCAVLFVSGCALTSKATPMEIRYFSPESLEAHRAAPATATPLARLRLGHLTSSANLRYRIVHRESAVELDTYETLRWTENPEDYVRRSLSHALFDDGVFEQVVSGPALTLDVGLVAFEEARRDQRPIGRVQLHYQLHDERMVLTSGVITVERLATASDIEPVVVAIGSAMNAASAELATKVTTYLRQR